MKLLFYILLYGYGISMGSSSIALFKKDVLPLWLTILNCISSLLILLTPISQSNFYLGLTLLFLSAITNGFILNGFPNWIHLIVRFMFSIFLIFLYYYFQIN